MSIPNRSGNTSDCRWDQVKVLKLIDILTKTYTINLSEFVIGNIPSDDKGNYFEVLVALVLSQNTSDKNAIKAFSRLKAVLGSVTPEKILELDTNNLRDLIKPAGLPNRRAVILKELASFVYRDNTFLDRLRTLDVEEAREKLLELPGVGFKTADVFLLMILRKPTFPIDTHINRVMKRLGLASCGDRYETIRTKIVTYLNNNTELLEALHLLLITHGRKVCTARNPKCNLCSVASLCCKNLTC